MRDECRFDGRIELDKRNGARGMKFILRAPFLFCLILNVFRYFSLHFTF